MNSPAPRSRLSPRRLSGALIWAAAFLLFAGLVVPWIHVNRFREGIRLALESALGGRKVEIGDVTLQLLRGPGFQLQNVIIGEDPAFGAEHLAYMSSMQVRLRLRTLWTGQVQLASITMTEPSINLVKNAQGRWNFEELLERAGSSGGSPARAAAPQRAYFPYIGIDSGRVNFKFGDYKSVFHFQDVEAAISPPRDAGGRWRMRFGGRPARTDRLLSGMGRITGDGFLSPGSPRTVELELALGTSPMAHLLTLIRGRDSGVHGTLAARARLSGEISRIQVQGILQVGDVHRWDLFPSQESRFSVPLTGRLDLPQQRLELETDPSRLKTVRVQFELWNYLSAPLWKTELTFNRAPADPFLRTAAHLGAALPAGIEVRGALDGRLAFSGSPWPQGALDWREAQVILPGCPPIVLDPVQAKVSGLVFEIPAVSVRIGKETLQWTVTGTLDRFSLDSRVAAQGVRLEALRRPAAALNLVWLGSFSSGLWDGRFFYRKQPGQPGGWSGSGTLKEARWQPEGLESPVEIAQARVRWEARGLLFEPLAGSLGKIHFTGSYQRSLAADSAPDRNDLCKLRITALDLAELDSWLNPKRTQSRWAVWMRALGRSSPEASSWLKRAKVKGAVTVGSLRIRNWDLRNVRSALTWSGDTLVLKGLRAEIGGGSVAGAFRAEFTGAVPRYSLEAAVRGVDLKDLADSAALPANFRSGTIDARVDLSAEGRTAQDLIAGLKAGGSFEGRSIFLEHMERRDAEEDFDGSVDIRLLRGRFELTSAGLELTAVRMTLGKEIYQGRGSIGGRPQVSFELAADGKSLRLVGAGAVEAGPGVP